MSLDNFHDWCDFILPNIATWLCDMIYRVFRNFCVLNYLLLFVKVAEISLLKRSTLAF
jgi:hypothetical protein